MAADRGAAGGSDARVTTSVVVSVAVLAIVCWFAVFAPSVERSAAPVQVLPTAVAKLADAADVASELAEWLTQAKPLLEDSVLDPALAIVPCFDEYAAWCQRARQWVAVGDSVHAALQSITQDVVLGTSAVLQGMQPSLRSALDSFRDGDTLGACQALEGVVAAVIDTALEVQAAHEQVVAVVPQVDAVFALAEAHRAALNQLLVKLQRPPTFLRHMDRMLRAGDQSKGGVRRRVSCDDPLSAS